MENVTNLEKINLPDATINAVVSDLCIGLITHDKIAKKYKISADTVTRINRLFGERIGQVKKEIRDNVLAESKSWATDMIRDMQKLTKELLDSDKIKQKLKKASFGQIVIGLGTLIDKIQILSGGATSRTEVVKMTSKAEMIEILTNGNQKSVKMIGKSTTIESANFEKNDEKTEENLTVTKNLVENILKNQ